MIWIMMMKAHQNPSRNKRTFVTLKEQMQHRLGNSWVGVMREFFHDKFRNFLNRLTGVEEFDIDSGETIVNPVGLLLSKMDIDSDE